MCLGYDSIVVVHASLLDLDYVEFIFGWLSD